MGLIYGNFSEKQKQVFNSFNEKIVDLAYAPLAGVEHVSFEDIKKATPKIIIDRLDWTKATRLSQPRSIEEIREWINRSQDEEYPSFGEKSVDSGEPSYDARCSISAMDDYMCVMIDGPGSSGNWSVELEDLPFKVGFWPNGQKPYEGAREPAYSTNNYETGTEVSGHSTAFIISAAIPEAEKLAIGELEILVAWESALSFRAVEKGFQGWSMNVITAWSTTCRLIVAEVDYELSATKLHVDDPIELEKHTKNTPEIEILLGWMLPHVKGDLRCLHLPASEKLHGRMSTLSIQPTDEANKAAIDNSD
ncbi:hypothetical protein VHEMI07650 [[Torrubiella] hemipterigena]|uniref:Uncharacterized protein n=1 Tax=[Torrubiella] hemipterigena TaxID=1531966 RepID=A0A0A1TB11_9HYPO|nr:hypothetical protein VHEMI07650 [[Torrubiella] hemipterigena]